MYMTFNNYYGMRFSVIVRFIRPLALADVKRSKALIVLAIKKKTEFNNNLFVILHNLVLKVSGNTRVCTAGNTALIEVPGCRKLIFVML